MTINIRDKGGEEQEARVLIEFAKVEANLSPDMLILLIKDLIAGKQDFTTKHWSWKVVEYIDQKTSAVSITKDADVDDRNYRFLESIVIFIASCHHTISYSVLSPRVF